MRGSQCRREGRKINLELIMMTGAVSIAAKADVTSCQGQQMPKIERGAYAETQRIM